MRQSIDRTDLSSLLWRFVIGRDDFDPCETALTLTGVDDRIPLESMLQLVDSEEDMSSEITFGPRGPGFAPPWCPDMALLHEDGFTEDDLAESMAYGDFRIISYDNVISWNHVRVSKVSNAILLPGAHQSEDELHLTERLSIRELFMSLINGCPEDEVLEITVRKHKRSDLSQAVDDLQLTPRMDLFTNDTGERPPAIHLETDETEYVERS